MVCANEDPEKEKKPKIETLISEISLLFFQCEKYLSNVCNLVCVLFNTKKKHENFESKSI